MEAEEAKRRPHVLAARKALVEALQARFQFKDYIHVVKEIPGLLQRHGLGQTLAYLSMRAGGNANSPFDLVCRQIDRWLFEAMGVSGRSALSLLAARDSRFYAEATEYVWLFIPALVTCVESKQ